MTRTKFFGTAILMAAMVLGASAQTVNINCGGNDFQATDGTQWVHDQFYNGGDLLYTSDGILNIAGQDMQLYRSGRAGLYGDFSYAIPVPNGSYTVSLLFSEIQYWNKGDRIFNVLLNGAPALTNFDILSQVAPRATLKQQFPVTVTNGTVQIAVNGVFRKGLLNGIQIAPSTVQAPPPVLSLGSTALSFSAVSGSASPAAQSVAVSNTGGGTMAWTASSNQTWLTVSPASGTNAGTLSIAANTAGLAAGTYSGAVTVNAGSTQSIAVTLTLTAPPALSISTSALSFSGTANGANPASQFVSISNTGGGTLNWSVLSNQAWLYASPASGTNAGTLSVGVNLAGLAAGTYSGTISVNGNTTKTIAVTLTVAAPVVPPTMALSTHALSFSATANGASPATQSVSVSNTGGGTLNWSVFGNQSWLYASPASGTNAGTISIGVNIAGLSAGTYSGAITVNGDTSQTISISLTVAAAPPVMTLSTHSLSFSGTANASNPAAQSVSVSNTGGGTLNWSASSNQSWLTVSPASGSNNGALSVAANLAGLSAGTYSGAITVVGDTTQTISVTLTVAAAPPAMTLSTHSLSFSGTANASNPAAQSVSVSNTGGGTLNWSASSNQSWLTVSPASGTNNGALSVAANLAGLAAGTYSGAITVVGDTTQTISVTLTVAAAPPAMTLSTHSLSFSGTANASNPAAQSVSVSNTGGGTLNWSASSNQSWLTVSPASGSNNGVLSIAANLAGLSAGTYSGAITVVGGTTQSISVTLTVAAAVVPPTLSVSGTSYSFSATAGGANPSAQTVNISNTGGGTLTWSAVSNQPWLTVSPASGTGAGAISIQPNVSGLAAGTYTGTVTITAPGATSGTQNVTATLVVSPATSTSLTTLNINAGGNDFTATDGTQWVHDQYYNGGDVMYSSDGVANTAPADLQLYRTARYGLYGDFSYAIPVTPGNYTVSLGFAEMVYWNTGDRIFNVSINGTQVLTNFDIVAQVGARVPLVLQFPAAATSGTIQIAVNGVFRKGILNAIRIASASGNPIVPATLVLGSTTLAFNGTAGSSNPAAQSVAVANGGSGVLTWTAASNQTWLSVSPAGGTGAGSISIVPNISGLAAGTYTGSITVTAPGASGSPSAIAVTLTVAPPPPVLTISTSAMSFSGMAGSTNPASQSFSVSNSGGGNLNWTASSNQSWLTVSPTSGTNAGSVTVSANLSGMAAGTYPATITVSAAGVSGSPKTVAVTFTVTGPPTLSLSTSALSFAGNTGGSNPASQSVSVSNSGGGTMSWTAGSNQTWLTVSPASGTNSGTLSVAANISGLAAGTYSGAITVNAGAIAGSPKTVSVTLTVTTTPITLNAAPTFVSLSNTAGGADPTQQSLSITNSGGTTTWTCTKTKPWLTISQMSGSGAASLAIGAVTTGMAAGTYTDTITVTGTSATNSPTSVNVTLNIAAASTTPPPVTSGASWYVSLNGSSSGDGSMNNPWDIVTAFAGPASVKPGDTIWMRAGKYGGGQYSSVLNSHLVGTPVLPIIVRAYPKERVIIDTWLQVGCCDGSNNPAAGSYTWFWGLELASFNPNRTSGTSGPPEWAFQYNHQATDVWGAGTKFINCIVHDTAGGISVWNAAGSELSGNIVFNIGGYATDRGHGHDFYLQNAAPSILKVNDNIGFNNFDMGLQAYGSSDAYVQNIQLKGNIVFNSGILYGQLVDNLTIGGGTGGPSGMVLDSNYFYDTPSLNQGYNELGFLWTPRSGDATVTNNYFVGGKQGIDLERWDTLTFQNNTVYAQSGDESMLIYGTTQNPANYNHGNNRYFGSGQFTIYPQCDYWPCTGPSSTTNFAGWMALTGLDRGSTYTPGAPTGLWTSVRPNLYEQGRANIVVYNWSLAPSVQVDLSNSGIKVGDPYQIRDAENWFNGAVASGTYTGAPVSVPMSGLTVMQPFGSIPYPPSHTAPQFGVFVLLSGNAMNVY